MIIEPKIRGFICTTAHPSGCAQHVQEQIDYVKKKAPITSGPKNVVVIGASTGYGLASRIVAAFGCGAATIGVFFEKPSDGKKTATAGWYNSAAFDQKAKEAGLYSKSFNGDAFSDEMKQDVIKTIQKDLGKIDLVIYSLASPRRVDPKTKELNKSVLKPLGQAYTNKTIDFSSGRIHEMTLGTASDEEVRQTVAVMGGEDWQMWMDALAAADVLSDKCLTVAYSYIGPELTQSVYRNGTIGAAKDHLEETAKKLDEQLKKKGGRAFISVNKALVTQSSSAIPFIPLYFIILKKIMIQKGIEENCIEQIYRLFAERLYCNGDIPVDSEGRIRIDDLELREDVQAEVQKCWEQLTTDNINDFADLKGHKEAFLRLFGFGFEGVDYQSDVDPCVDIK